MAPKEIEGVSQRDYARSRNITHKSVQNAIKDGRLKRALIPFRNSFRIDPDIADEEWATNTIHDKRPNDVTGNKNANDYVAPPISPSQQEKIEQLRRLGIDEDIPELAISRRINEHYTAQIRRLEFQEKEKSLIPAEDISEVWGELLTNFATKLRALPAKLSPLVTSVKDEGENQKHLEDAVDECLRELSAYEFEVHSE
ncbi:hypothetical protein HBN50_07750 [Halobacteriovorax sp. GB3]|uniref:hypothetical protein n=1 Tax=Halobacteriovorax sp. GB3 TaxID=2719615 RepID=UPI00235EB4F2|nr:hypothetical protein [Halobacteriovorax sp. GB3]MDD0852985.1 hypothetical protein [Halobacteriovorax sp. GB3]